MSAAAPTQPVQWPVPRVRGVAHRKGARDTAPRIQPKVRHAVHDMVWEGLKPQDAADRYNINFGAFVRALERPSVQALVNAEIEVLRTSARPEAVRRIIDLISSAESEKVQLHAAKYIDSNGLADRPQFNVQVNVQQPGYVLAIDPRHLEDEQQPTRLTTLEAKALPDNKDVPR